jgi:hypothetical protein
MSPDPALERPESFVSTAARVSVALANGEQRERTAWEPKGSPSTPLTQDELFGKYQACVEPVLGSERASNSFEGALALGNSCEPAELIRLLVPEGRTSGR